MASLPFRYFNKPLRSSRSQRIRFSLQLFSILQPTVVDGQGNTPLHMACMNRDKECVAALTRPITLEEQRHYDLCERIPQVLPFDLEQRNYYGKLARHFFLL